MRELFRQSIPIRNFFQQSKIENNLLSLINKKVRRSLPCFTLFTIFIKDSRFSCHLSCKTNASSGRNDDLHKKAITPSQLTTPIHWTAYWPWMFGASPSSWWTRANTRGQHQSMMVTTGVNTSSPKLGVNRMSVDYLWIKAAESKLFDQESIFFLNLKLYIEFHHLRTQGWNKYYFHHGTTHAFWLCVRIYFFKENTSYDLM